ncbi:MAG: 3-isopropylmalate dehydratase large subunit [Betaproteobacteria bacterium]|nr:3-isopropylmalate dehydratase large subunit [Betaproteobacteria bacterium]
MPTTLFDKLWQQHVVAELDENASLLHVDRHLLIDLHSPMLTVMAQRGLKVRNPEMNYSVADHVVTTEPGRSDSDAPSGNEHIQRLRSGSRTFGIRMFDVRDEERGISHVIGPDLGITQPGMLLLVGDSHTSTHGAFGALAFGIGASEVMHVLATQTLVQRKPKRMRLTFVGVLPPGVEAKDMILHAIGRLGTAGGTGHAIEYAGPAIRALGAEGRLTLCNLSVEMGAKVGMIAPDEKIFEWLLGRPHAPRAEHWDRALAYWRTLRSDEDATFDREVTIDVSAIRPQVTWGTSPQDVIGVDGVVPDPASAADAERRSAMGAALEYMGLTPGRPIAGTRIDRVFIGSCTNSRLSDLRHAAQVARGRKVAAHVRAWVVPGSMRVKRDAEAEGLDRVFREAGFEWRDPGCSMCVGANGELVAPRERCVSTSNRNFVGRQGPGARTHLASPAMAAAAAIAGEITDVRKMSVAAGGD